MNSEIEPNPVQDYVSALTDLSVSRAPWAESFCFCYLSSIYLMSEPDVHRIGRSVRYSGRFDELSLDEMISRIDYDRKEIEERLASALDVGFDESWDEEWDRLLREPFFVIRNPQTPIATLNERHRRLIDFLFVAASLRSRAELGHRITWAFVAEARRRLADPNRSDHKLVAEFRATRLNRMAQVLFVSDNLDKSVEDVCDLIVNASEPDLDDQDDLASPAYRSLSRFIRASAENLLEKKVDGSYVDGFIFLSTLAETEARKLFAQGHSDEFTELVRTMSILVEYIDDSADSFRSRMRIQDDRETWIHRFGGGKPRKK